uniref:3-oxoacyl-[acyl-carrier protein] reductase n=1 Tax=Haliea sp. ETY-M TaxID=1055105 RepID=A0A455R1Y1_9GAMM|nr:3-oxoacyl-[acyl-carrier protein] reductase [Haliea sp. ETY-M]
MKTELSHEVVVITGGASGIGLETAHICAREGAAIGIVDINPEHVKTAVEALTANGASAAGAVADVTDARQMQEAVAKFNDELGSVTGLVNNAGIAGFGATHQADEDEWERVMAVNVTGTYLASQAVLPGMIEKSHGAIVNFGSVAGLAGIPNMAAYCAAKGAVVALTRQMAADYSKSGIRVNAVCPGTVASTDMGAQLLGSDNSPEIQARRLAKYPIGRFGEPHEIGEVVAFLLGRRSSFVCGALFSVDGGMIAI